MTNEQDTNKIKIAKFLAQCGLGSRRHCEELVEEGRIRVNGRRMTNVAERIDPDTDIVEHAGKRLQPATKAVFALYKPVGYISTLSDPHASLTIAELIPAKYRGLGLKPVGRLDKESEGLMLLTNDGQLANKLTHPRYGVTKVYLVKLDNPPPDRILHVIRKGAHLPRERRLRPMGVCVVGRGPEAARDIELTLREGRKHEIRRVFGMFGYNVLKLKRIAMGTFELGRISKGQLVRLTDGQVRKLREACGLD